MSLRATTPRWIQSTSSFKQSSTRESPIRKLADASKQCSEQGQIYAQCIFKAQFSKEGTGVERGICEKEFAAFKECVQTKVSSSFLLS
jgi:NADH dehydrogenase [ubiquinone] 1 alpha subcomplex assembly factor 8